MNEENTIEQQLEIELSRLKKAIEYIEQAEKSVQQVQEQKKEFDIKHKGINLNIQVLKSSLNSQKLETNNRLEQIVNDLDKLAKIVSSQNRIIELCQIEIERLKNVKWYQRLI